MIQSEDFLQILKTRFQKNMHRHAGLLWENIEIILKSNPKKLTSLQQMEATGGEPDLVIFDQKVNQYIFFDCSPESPKDRRSLCYDSQALNSRKNFKPKTSAQDMAAKMGVDILTETQYRFLQTLGKFDTKTSSWIQTPPEIRHLGGAIFADCRYDHVFVYHNGAESYYASRGFRSSLKFK